jgi:hypothetical protein
MLVGHGEIGEWVAGEHRDLRLALRVEQPERAAFEIE